MKQDEEYLRLLSIFHYIVGGLAGLFALFPIIHLVIGLVFILAPQSFEPKDGEPMPAFFGWFFVILASVFIIVGWILAILIIVTGRFLARRTHWLFCIVMAGTECIFMPFGMVLGIFTIITLMRESTKALFSANPSVQQPF